MKKELNRITEFRSKSFADGDDAASFLKGVEDAGGYGVLSEMHPTNSATPFRYMVVYQTWEDIRDHVLAVASEKIRKKTAQIKQNLHDRRY